MTGPQVAVLSALPASGAVGFRVGSGDWPLRGILVRRGALLKAYLNLCPHAGHRLDLVADRYTNPEGDFLRCHSHGAEFRFEDGLCVAGPCTGQSLSELDLVVVGDAVHLATTPAGSAA